mmetsp:Transcript_37213/g.105033  ORF Transcript_37213/g.105033 Transcript_37213/m.105033 type:complete len:540 (-) Transcript_37213:1635-3254(-)
MHPKRQQVLRATLPQLLQELRNPGAVRAPHDLARHLLRQRSAGRAGQAQHALQPPGPAVAPGSFAADRAGVLRGCFQGVERRGTGCHVARSLLRRCAQARHNAAVRVSGRAIVGDPEPVHSLWQYQPVLPRCEVGAVTYPKGVGGWHNSTHSSIAHVHDVGAYEHVVRDSWHQVAQALHELFGRPGSHLHGQLDAAGVQRVRPPPPLAAAGVRLLAVLGDLLGGLAHRLRRLRGRARPPLAGERGALDAQRAERLADLVQRQARALRHVLDGALRVVAGSRQLHQDVVQRPVALRQGLDDLVRDADGPQRPPAGARRVDAVERLRELVHRAEHPPVVLAHHLHEAHQQLGRVVEGRRGEHVHLVRVEALQYVVLRGVLLQLVHPLDDDGHAEPHAAEAGLHPRLVLAVRGAERADVVVDGLALEEHAAEHPLGPRLPGESVVDPGHLQLDRGGQQAAHGGAHHRLLAHVHQHGPAGRALGALRARGLGLHLGARQVLALHLPCSLGLDVGGSSALALHSQSRTALPDHFLFHLGQGHLV